MWLAGAQVGEEGREVGGQIMSSFVGPSLRDLGSYAAVWGRGDRI